MDPVDINKMVESAKADASAVGVHSPHKESLASANGEIHKTAVDELGELAEDAASRLDRLVEEEKIEDGLAKEAALERGRNFFVAKLLMALDVLSEVS